MCSAQVKNCAAIQHHNKTLRLFPNARIMHLLEVAEDFIQAVRRTGIRSAGAAP